MDQARNVLNSYIPATQWAMNYLNNNITQAGGNFSKGFLENPQNVPTNAGLFESTGNSVANATPVGGAEADLVKGAHMLSSVHLPLALGILSNQSTKFGNALRNAGKALPENRFNMSIDPESARQIMPAISRVLTQASNPNYFINQLGQDHAAIAPMAESYMPGVTKELKNDPIQIARALFQRIQNQGQYGM